MASWTSYRDIARGRGALAYELFVVESTAESLERMREALPEHLAYQKALEAQGSLFLAGPLSDASGEETSGGGLMIYRAASLEAARALADADPMHRTGARRYSLRRWLVNEGALAVSVTLSDQRMRLDGATLPSR